MSVILAILGITLKLIGVAFLVIASIGLIRFHDPFQRMHAATKAGTVGAASVLLGVAISLGQVSTFVIAVVTIIFLMATMPIAAHLLGRASYVSGADLVDISWPDALAGVIERQELSLENRVMKPLSEETVHETIEERKRRLKR